MVRERIIVGYEVIDLKKIIVVGIGGNFCGLHNGILNIGDIIQDLEKVINLKTFLFATDL